jgi:transcriptional regulator with XRE-family HTH domain
MGAEVPMTKLGGWGESSGFAVRLRVLREGRGLYQGQLAERAGTTQSTVAKLEAGTQEPAWPLVIALAEALGATPNDFLPRAGEKAPPPLKRGRPAKPKAAGTRPPAPPAPPLAEDLEDQAEAGPAATRVAKPKRPRARRPKGQ